MEHATQYPEEYSKVASVQKKVSVAWRRGAAPTCITALARMHTCAWALHTCMVRRDQASSCRVPSLPSTLRCMLMYFCESAADRTLAAPLAAGRAPAPARCATTRHGAHECMQVDEVKSIMTDNIEKVLARGEKLDLLSGKTEDLMFEVGMGALLGAVPGS